VDAYLIFSLKFSTRYVDEILRRGAEKAGDAILTKADVLNKLAEVRALFPATP
jgi:hypothetical protein